MASAAPSAGKPVPVFRFFQEEGPRPPIPTWPSVLPMGSPSSAPSNEDPKPFFLVDMNASSSAYRKPVVFGIGGAAPRSSSSGGVKGKDSTGKGAAAAEPRPERDVFVPKIFTTADVLDVISEDRMRDMLLAAAKDSGLASLTDLSSRGCWVSKEDGDVMQLKADMPGLGKEHVKVRVEKDAVVIKGEGGKDCNYRIGLPSSQTFKMDQIKAELKNGVLVVTMPKTKDEERTKDVYEIKVE